MNNKIFLSYEPMDKNIAEEAIKLFADKKIECLTSTESKSEVDQKIEQSNLLVLIFSSNSNKSENIIREINIAVSKGKTILPIRVENIYPSGAMSYYLAPIHYIDGIGENAVSGLKTVVERALFILTPNKMQRGRNEKTIKNLYLIPSQLKPLCRKSDVGLSLFDLDTRKTLINGVNLFIEGKYEMSLKEFTAIKHSSSANCFTGYIYQNGFSGEKNYQLAIEWYTEGCNKSDDIAMCLLGYMHENGLGTEKNIDEALSWYNEASKWDNPQGLNNAGIIYLTLKKDYDKAFKSFTKSASLNHKQALNNLAYMYYHGLGVEKDYNKAMNYINILNKEHFRV